MSSADNTPSDKQAILDFARDLDFSAILTNPILDIAARFWEDDRYDAFKICYRSMRRIDDLVDDRKAGGAALSESEIVSMSQQMIQWLEAVRAGRAPTGLDPEFTTQFLSTLQQFRIPIWPWERLCRAMVFDLTHEGFASFTTFLRYTEGAAIAPASVFMHLCGLRPAAGGFDLPPYDIRLAARPLAVFSYLVHILRDFEKDQKEALNYFALDLCEAEGLRPEDLREVAESGQASGAFRRLIRRYANMAEYYRRKALLTVDSVRPLLAPRYQLSLEIIYGLYHQIFELIDPEKGQFTTEATNATSAQVNAHIEDILDSFEPTPVAFPN